MDDETNDEMDEVVTQKGRMNKEDEDVLQEHIQEIEKDLEAKDVTGQLYARYVIDSVDKDQIESRTTRAERARTLISILILQGPGSFKEFLDILDNAGYKELVRKLTERRNNRAMARTSREPEYHDWLRQLKWEREFTYKVQALTKLVIDLDKKKANTKELSDKLEYIASDLEDIKRTVGVVEDLTRKIKESEGQIIQLKEQLKEKDDQVSKGNEKIQFLDERVESLEKLNSKLNECLGEQNRRVKTLEEKAVQLDSLLDEQAQQLVQQSDKLVQQEVNINELKQKAEVDRARYEAYLQEQDRKLQDFQAEQETKLKEIMEYFQRHLPATIHTRPVLRYHEEKDLLSDLHISGIKLGPRKVPPPLRKFRF